MWHQASIRLRQGLLVVVVVVLAALAACGAARPVAPAAPPGPPPAARDGQHDFDFEIGRWKTHVRRLHKPLTGSTTWVEYEGTTVVRPVWNGRANLVELDVAGPAGRIEGLSLRLYDPGSGRWSLHFASSHDGAMSPPTIGGFENGRGEFIGHESIGGKDVLVRFVIFDITPTSARFEQAFSLDGGTTWEVNWIATDTRVGDAPLRDGD